MRAFFWFAHGLSWLIGCFACIRIYHLGHTLAPHRPFSTALCHCPFGAVRTAVFSTHEKKPRSSLSVRRRVHSPRGRLADAAAVAVAAAAAGAGSALAAGARRRERTLLRDKNRSSD
eukprot:COSAG01_NODE_676_length_14324_cov_17.420105_16_plen_117_part_00